MKTFKLASMPTIKRLPAYLHIVEAAAQKGWQYISGTAIAEELQLEPIQVRKDLAATGIIGKPRIGFPVPELIEAINAFLDWNNTHNALIVGAGYLGTALAGYAEFRRHGLLVVAAVDADPEKIGTSINDVPVFGMADLKEKIDAYGIEIAVLTVPSHHAQNVADDLVRSGIRAIWNFTNEKLKVPPDVIVQKEDLSSGYAMLSVRVRLSNTSRWS